LSELETGERGREESWERGGWCWMRAGCDTAVFVVFVVAVEVGLLVDVNPTHFHWLTREFFIINDVRADSGWKTYCGGGLSSTSSGGGWMFIS
jgi:hypothetical protein